MKFEKQVEEGHYEFSRYMSKSRWCSVWHQLDEVQKLKPNRVLEVGPGPGLFKTVAATFGISVETLDFDPDLKPDHVGSATAMPFSDGAYDVVCAFQMLEHLPYEAALQAFGEMARVSRSHVIISLPDARPVWRYQLHIPKLGSCDFFIPRPLLKAPVHVFDGEHYWEINKQGYPLSRVIADCSKHLKLVKTYRVFENSSHRFFIFEH
ncbi:MAG TPA: class I SAM-dependent methyltransferase [Candidatus Competibacteraceae bacterium]|nr:class I SAM-dependent methyltransferase [Candidatus Competibacteraceae bacterium]